jgi:hypothetical protein
MHSVPGDTFQQKSSPIPAFREALKKSLLPLKGGEGEGEGVGQYKGANSFLPLIQRFLGHSL